MKIEIRDNCIETDDLNVYDYGTETYHEPNQDKAQIYWGDGVEWWWCDDDENIYNQHLSKLLLLHDDVIWSGVD